MGKGEDPGHHEPSTAQETPPDNAVVERLEIPIPPHGLAEILANYSIRDYATDITFLADPEGLTVVKSGARIRVEYFTALLRYTAARCARAAAGNHTGHGQGPTMPEYYLHHSMGNAFNKDLVANEWADLRKMCPHLMGWRDNGDGTETCAGCKVTVVTATKHDDNPQIVETPPEPKPDQPEACPTCGGTRDKPNCPDCHERPCRCWDGDGHNQCPDPCHNPAESG